MFYPFTPFFFGMILLFVIWEVIWKGIGLWKSARNGQKTWFISILVFNTLGILPIVYITFFSKTRKKRRR
ncbi:MAG: hypothetical protein HYW24_02190 [Candidatus Aenigmarchaeota archaeon]|nr:hypothetical protein [Candidatus Aenigmarchaeota archaeon]